MKTIVLFLLGCVFKVYGYLTTKLDWMCLGHYLMGSGHDFIIPKKFNLLIAYDIARKFAEGGGMCRLPIKHPGKKYPNYMETGVYLNTFENRRGLFRALGKSVINVKWGTFRVFDRYQYYPPCNLASTHFKGCKCAYKEWSTLQPTIISISLTKLDAWINNQKETGIGGLLLRIRRIKYHKNIYPKGGPLTQFHIYLNLTTFVIWVGITDEWFARVGKPFNIFSLPITL